MSEPYPLADERELDVKSIDLSETPLTQKQIDRLWLKVDLRIIWPITLVYLLQYMDKSNIGNAKIAGLVEQLNLSASQFSWVLTICKQEIPSNMVLKAVRPSVWLSALCVSFGLCLALMGLCTSYAGILVARFFLGVTTAGVFPGAAYFFTLWYPSYKLAFRFSIFIVACTLAGSFSGLISAGISTMDGARGLLGWSWIFIVMGSIAGFCGIILYFFLHDYPERAKFLTEKEKKFIRETLTKDQGEQEAHGRVTRAHVMAALKDWQTWSFCFQYYTYCVPLFSLAIFVPSIVSGLGYEGYHAQLMSVPPFAISIPFIIGVAWLSDHYKRRAPFVFCGFTLGMVGWIILTVVDSPKGRYAGVVIASIGHWPSSAPCNMAAASCMAPNGKRAVAVGILMGLGNLCGIITSQVFRTADAPRYYPGLHAMMFFSGAGMIQTCILWVVYSRINRKREALMASGEVQYTLEELKQMGDKAPTFRYLFP